MRGALAFIAIAIFSFEAACGLFVGPATALHDTDFYRCGDQRCRIGWEDCSTGLPHRCMPAYDGLSRDAGADR